MIMRYSVMGIVALVLCSCSHMEYAATQSRYHIAATTTLDPAQTIENVKNIPNLKGAEEDFALPAQPKTSQVLSVTKKDAKSLGNLYLPNSFSTNQDDLVFEIRRESRSYKAVTPFLFDSSHFNSHLALSVNSSTAMTAGLEFKIPFGSVK